MLLAYGIRTAYLLVCATGTGLCRVRMHFISASRQQSTAK